MDQNSKDRQFDKMIMTYFRVGLLSLSVLSSQGMANITRHYNYYHSGNSTFLESTEKFHLEQARHKQAQGETEQAWNELAFVLHYFPNHPQALEQIGELGLKTNQVPRAHRYFERAIQLYPLESKTRYLYGVSLMRNAKYNDAITQFKEAVRLDPPSLDAQNQLKVAQLKNKNSK